MTNRFNKVLLASALALWANMKAQANDIQVTDDTKDVVSTTKIKVDGVRDLNNQMWEQWYWVSKDKNWNLILSKNTSSSTISNSDVLSYSINFSVNPTSAFDLWDVSDFSKDEISTFKKIPWIRVFKWKLSYTPSKTLDYLKSQKAIYESDLKRVFANNPFIIKHFQFYLNSKLWLNWNTFSWVIDKNIITKTSSVLKNESIFNAFDNVLSSYWPAWLRVFSMNWKTVLVNTNLWNFADKDALAILDMPYFDENGEIHFSNEFNELLLDFPTEWFSYIAWLNDNKIRLITSKWLESVNAKLPNISYTNFDLGKVASWPTILSGIWQVLSWNLSDKSALWLLIRNNTLWLNHQDEITLDKINIKTTLEFIAEATNKWDNSRVAAKLIMLYSMARVWTTIYMEKWDQTSKFWVWATYMTDAWNVIKLDYWFFKKFMEYTFPEVNKKYNLAPEQHGLSLSYTQNDIEKFEMLKELTYSLRAFKVETLDMWEVWKLTRDVNNIFEQYKVLWALQGWKKFEAEVNFAFDLAKALSEEMWLMDIRLDVAPRVWYTKYDDVLDIKWESKFWAWLRTKLSTLIFDKTVKASILSDIYTWWIYSYWIELSKKLEFWEATFYVKQDKFWPDTSALNSIWIKWTFENPFWLQDVEEKDVPTYASLFSENQRNFKFLTYEQADFDQKLVSGYAIAPKAQIQKIRELMIDKSTLPAGSTLEKNDDGTLKQINLNTGVNDLDGTISVAPAAYLSHFSITGTSFITVKNVENMAVPQTYNLVAWQTGWGFVIMSLTLTKWSVMINQTVKYLAWVSNALAQEFLNGTKTFEEIKAIIDGLLLPTSSFANSTVTKLTTNWTFTNTFTTNSPWAVTYSSSNTSVATVNSSTWEVTIVWAWTVTITANQAAAIWFMSDTDTYELTINAAPDTTPPVTSDNITPTQTTASIVINSNESWEIRYIVQLSSVLAPDLETLKTSWISLAMLSWNNTINLSWLTESTWYSIYYVAKDAAWNWQTTLTTKTFNTTATADTTPPLVPTLTTAAPQYTNQNSVSVEVNWEVWAQVWVNGVNTWNVIGAGWTVTINLNTSWLDWAKNFLIRLKDSSSNESDPLSVTINKDTEAPISMSFSGTTPNTKTTQYNGLILSVWENLTWWTLTSITSSKGWTISWASINWSWDIVFNWLTPNESSSQLRAIWTDRAWNSFDITLNVNLPNSPSDTEKPSTPTLSISDWDTSNWTWAAWYTNSTSVSISITWDTDNVWVTGWYVSESSSTPSVSAWWPNLSWQNWWHSTKPTSVNISLWDETKTLYVWTKDEAWNVSLAWSDTIILDTTVYSADTINLDQVITWASLEGKTITITSSEKIKIISWATIWLAVIPTTSDYEENPIVNITWIASTPGNYSGTIRVQDERLNEKNITVNFVVLPLWEPLG